MNETPPPADAANDDAAAASEAEAAATEAVEPESETAALEARIAELEAAVAEHKDQHLRALAEAENTRRRMTREREDAVRFAATGFARDLLSVADNLRRALDSLPEAQAHDEATRTLLAGVAATERELLSAFERNGIKRIDAIGQKFDHNLHQAMFELENTGQPAGTVAQVLQPGYVLHERLLRPAMVGVAKGGAAQADTKPEPRPGFSRVDTTA